MITNILILTILLFLSAFFSAAEVAFVSLSNAKVQTMVKKGLPRAEQIKKLKSNPRRLLITILIGNNIVNIAAASFATVVATEMFASAVIGITTGVMTILVLIFGEIIPKSYAASFNKRFAILSTPYLRLMMWVGFPLIIIFEALTNLFAGKHRVEKVSEEELKIMAHTAALQGNIEQDERKMMERLFRFNDITAEDIMTPRVQMIYLNHSLTVHEAIDVIAKNPHTRFPVAKASPDHIIGFVHSRDVLLSLSKGDESKQTKDIMHPILRVPRQIRIDELLPEFQKKQTHIAVVQDELGGTEGIVTLEDVLEELVGEITDEHDVEDNIMKRIDKHTAIVSGEEQIRDINSFLQCLLPGDPLDTIAEIMLDKLGKVPRKGMEISLDGITCKVESVRKKTIHSVRIEKK